MRRKKSLTHIPLPGSKKTTLYLQFAGILCCIFIFLTGCSSIKQTAYNPSAKLPPEKLKEDFTLLKKILEANHPSLYWYTPKDSMDVYFSETLNNINDSLTELQFKNKVAWFIGKIRCGHTSVRPSKAFTEYASVHRNSQFPLYIKAWGDTLAVLASLNKADSVFKRGTVITSIDGMSNRALLDSMFNFISTDGHGDNYKNQVISFNFPLYYSFAFPLKDSFAINYIDSSGLSQAAFVRLYRPRIDSSKQKKEVVKKTNQPSRKEIKAVELHNKRSLSYDSSGQFAFMRVTTFSSGGLRHFFKESFEDLQNRKTPNLIVDLRENSGGSIGASTNFARYIKNKPFNIADTVAAVNRSFTYSKYIHPALPYRILMRFATRKKSDGKFHFTALENRVYKPFKRTHFN
ncbi:MAG TPA: S41 family peptidase, partial [Panacibacter sp.]|nr:S41 family peptidase [Panacibacter sp.]